MRPIFKALHLPPGVSLEEHALPLQTGRAYDLKSKVHLMWAAVILVLIIGCVNISGILLARSAARSREIATRMALGASRVSIIGQLFAESLLLSLAGGILGILTGYFALDALRELKTAPIGFAMDFSSFDLFHPVQLDLRVVAVTIAIALVTSILFGLVPAIEATSLDLRSSLAEGGRGATNRHKWIRNALVFGEVALGVVLVISSGLLIRTFAHLTNLSPGFNPNHVMTASLSLEDARYQTTASGVHLFDQTLDRIRQIPGVESAAATLSTPFERPLNWLHWPCCWSRTRRTASPISPGSHPISSKPCRFLCSAVACSRIPTTAPPPASWSSTAPFSSASSSLARTRSAQMSSWKTSIIKSSASLPMSSRETAGAVNLRPLPDLPKRTCRWPKSPDGMFAGVNVWFPPSFIVRTHGTIAGLPEAMRRALRAVDARLPFSSFHSMSEIRGAALSDQRYQAVLFSTLAGLALLLAALGIYGLIAQSVAERRREMGIRLALGATTQRVIRTAALPGIRISLAGIGGGIVLALFATRLLKSLIWGVGATDPQTFLSVSLLLLLVAAVASFIPALRLTRLDPAETLREE